MPRGVYQRATGKTTPTPPRVIKEYQTLYTIPMYLVQSIGDDGMTHIEEGEEKNIDDLRETIELSGGLKVLLDGQCRLVLSATGIDVQYLIDVEPNE